MVRMLRAMDRRRRVGLRFPGLAESSIDEVVDALCELDIELGHPTGIVGGELEFHLGVANDDFGVMLGFFGNFREVVHKIDRIVEFFEFHGAGDGFFIELPLRAFAERLLQFIFF